ncbi:MAG: SDR family NAD(P)-dependent oxidoreductase [Chromatiales bacterium]
MIRINRRTAVFLHDLMMVALAWECAWLARANLYAALFTWKPSVASFVIALATQAVVFWRIGLYRGLWRFASLPDLWNIIRAAAFGTVFIGVFLFIHSRLENVPRSILILYPIFLVMLLSGPRLLYRLWKDRTITLKASTGKRVVVIGAGHAAEALVRDMVRDGRYLPVGLLDDRESLRHTQIHGVLVYGGIDLLPEVARSQEAEFLVIAIPSASNEQMQRIVDLCERSGVPFRTLPRLVDRVQGEFGINALREVSIDDLLGREKVRLDWPLIQESLTGKVIVVTGGGGSIGAELCRQIARLGPHELVIFEQSEYNLYRIEMELRQQGSGLRFHALLGDVSDEAAVNHVLRTYKPHTIFHAAAYKHVPMLQYQGREAIRNNVIGAWRLANAAIRHGCRRFVLISTDKAVNPSSIMGASKRIAEVVCEHFNQFDRTRFITVRFGNVLGSAGSVVPLFQEQIRTGGPVTVTHPDMTRYFMTIPEATQLIMQAAAMGQGGEIFVLDMGQPIRIAYLAEQMIRLSGMQPGSDIQIEFTGLRPGERLREELFHVDEQLERTRHAKIQLARHRPVESDALEDAMNDFIAACEEFDEEWIGALVRRLVPEMQTPEPPSVAGNVVAFQKGAS